MDFGDADSWGRRSISGSSPWRSATPFFRPSRPKRWSSLAALWAFLLGGAYWTLLANSLMKALGSPVETARMPAQALVLAFVTRVAQALAIAVLVSYSAADGILGGAVVGCAACIGFVLPIMVGQAAFGPPWGSWPRLLVGAPEVLAGFIVAGAIIGAWHN